MSRIHPRTISSVTFAIANYATIVLGQYTQPYQWPGFTDLDPCVQGVFGDQFGLDGSYLGSDIGCDTWACVCDNLDRAGAVGSSLVSQACTGDATDIAAETSLLTSFCLQLHATATVVETSSSATNVLGMPTVTSTPTTTSSSQLSAGTIVGVAIGSFFLIGMVAYLCRYYNRQSYMPAYRRGGYNTGGSGGYGSGGYGGGGYGGGGYSGGGRPGPLVKPYPPPKEETMIHGGTCMCEKCKRKRNNDFVLGPLT